ncbi:hypothetical protein CC1G_15410 [Coprinopsis cinerea okayama7|uniref:RING-type domain-containing protein n=1 Tax=Coprinopsis cinerea (strain Okayama-7 / 130 / ATCC MYA-4618 / FGSC 9003) TaxID=240176 RepID=D6RQM5_COPC7|nr:hypothetical protein CC1G_15410 [Coprinopsis cinerea okayama7\|eukprot:XP_002910132.1 hypothetical protein CC1G_15410 [Coprinopsis cinerea okayama7\
MFSAFRARRYSGLHAGGSLVAETSRERSRQRDELDLGVLRREPSTSRRSETSSLLGSRDLDAEDRGVFLPRRREEILNASRDTEMTDLARLFNSTDEPSSGRRPGESGESGRTGEARSAGTSTSTSTISRRAFNNWDFPDVESDSDSDDSLWRSGVPRPSMRRGQASLRPSSPQNRNTHVATSNTNPSDRPTSVTIPSVSIPPLHGDLISLRRYLDIQIGDDDASTRLSGEQLRTPVNRNPPSQAPPARPFLPIPVPSPNLDVEFGDRTGSSTRPGQGQSQSQQDDSTRSSISLNPPQPPSSRPSSSIENFRQAFRERGRQLSERNISRLLGHGSSGPSGLETPSAARPTNASNAGGSLASPLDLPSPHDPTGARFGFLYRRIGVPSDDPPSTGNPSNPSRAPDRLSDMFAPGPYQNTFRMLELERRRRMGEGEPSGSSTMSANARRFSTPSALSMPPHRPSPLSTAAPSIPPPPASTSQAAPTVPTLMSGMRVATATPHRYDASVTAGLGRAGRNAPPATTQSSDRPVRPLPLNPPSSHAIRPRPLHQHPTTVQRDPWERWLYEDSESDTSLDPLFVPRPRNGGPRTRGIDPLSAQAEELRRATRDLAQLHDDLSTLVAPRRRTYDVDGIELRHRPPAAANRNTPSASNSTTTTAPRHPGREEFRRRYLEIATLGGSGTEQPPERQTRPTGDAIRRVLHRAQRFGGFRRPLAGFNPGDFMNDDEFDDSYETLLSLTEELGEVRPRRTPANVIDSFTSASYSELANGESDKRCPICLDDYAPQDPVLKLDRCPHFMHKDCLKQWLNQATTCPVCREPVMEKKSPFMPPNRAPSASAAGPSTTSTSSSSRPRPDPLSFAMNRPRWPSELGSIRQIVPTRNPRIPEGSASLGFMPHPSRLSPINIRIGGPSRNNTNNNNNNNNNSSNSSDTNANNSHNPATGPPRGPQRPREDTSMDSDSSSDFMRF